jgi:GDPmannose 4,6-dehydratase
MRAAFITGVSGQDGSYLSELLLNKGYTVYGLTRYCSEVKHERITDTKKHASFTLVYGDLTDTARLTNIINSLTEYDRIEVYNLGAQSHVKVSFDQPEYTANVDAIGTLRLLEAIRQSDHKSKFRFYQAGTSEMFGKVQETPQTENTPFYPRSPYGVSKLFAYWMTKNYRESYKLFACTGILFNHESERRGEEFVTRKVTKGLVNWIRTSQPLELGNLDAKRDWGHAEDYVEAMWRMLQTDEPEDFVIATGETHSIRDFIEECCNYIGRKIVWEGEGVDEVGRDFITHEVIVKVNPEFFRPAEVDILIGDYSHARDKLGWSPSTSFKQLVQRMLESDQKAAGDNLVKVL